MDDEPQGSIFEETVIFTRPKVLFPVSIIPLDGEAFTVEIAASDLVLALKEKAATAKGVAVQAQELYLVEGGEKELPNECKVADCGITQGCEILMMARGGLPDLSSLTVSGSSEGVVSEMVVAALTAVHEQRSSSVTLTECGLGESHAKMIGEALIADCHALELDLSGNPIGDEGACALGDLLGANTTLQRLRLENCSLTAVGGKALAAGLKKNKRSALLHLHLDFNLIRDQGSKALCDALRTDPSLTYLSLNHVDMGQKAVHHIAEAIKFTTHLAELHMGGNARITSTQELYTSLSRRSGLQWLRIEPAPQKDEPDTTPYNDEWRRRVSRQGLRAHEY